MAKTSYKAVMRLIAKISLFFTAFFLTFYYNKNELSSIKADTTMPATTTVTTSSGTVTVTCYTPATIVNGSTSTSGGVYHDSSGAGFTIDSSTGNWVRNEGTVTSYGNDNNGNFVVNMCDSSSCNCNSCNCNCNCNCNAVAPTISVTNSNEFVNYTFSKTGKATSSATPFVDYNATTTYSDTYAGQQNEYNGIFVVINAYDGNYSDYLKGTAYLQDQLGNTIATSVIKWSSSPTDPGTNVIQSQTQNIKGYAFFSKDSLPDNVELEGAIIKITVQDYSDSSCTSLSSSGTTSQTISASNSQVLNVNIHTVKPQGTVQIVK